MNTIFVWAAPNHWWRIVSWDINSILALPGIEESIMEPINIRSHLLPSWTRSVFEAATSHVRDLATFSHISSYSLRLMMKSDVREEFLADALSRPGAETEVAKASIKKQLADFLDQETSAQESFIFGHSLVQCWGVLEALVLEVAFAFLYQGNSAWQQDAVKKVKISLGEYHSLEGDAKVWYVIDRLDRPRVVGAARFHELFDALGLPTPNLSDDLKKELIELQQVRNLLVHHRGVVDQRFLDRCPWLKERHQLGEPIVVTGRMFCSVKGGYLTSVLRYIQYLCDALLDRFVVAETQE